MPQVQMKIRATSEHRVDFSTAHPDAEFRILASRPTQEEGGFLLVGEIEMENPDTILQYFNEASDIRSYEVLQTGPGSLLIQHVIEEPIEHRVAQETGTVANFPVVVRDGWLVMELLITHNRLSAFTERLTDVGVTFEILSVTQSMDVLDVLTERQWQFITAAVERGYYASPRECTLVDLADTLEVSQSTASGILHRAEGQIIREFVGALAM